MQKVGKHQEILDRYKKIFAAVIVLLFSPHQNKDNISLSNLSSHRSCYVCVPVPHQSCAAEYSQSIGSLHQKRKLKSGWQSRVRGAALKLGQMVSNKDGTMLP